MGVCDPRKIRLVAGRYRELQGLATVADAAVLLVCAAVFPWAVAAPGRLNAALALVGACVLVRATWIRLRLKAYYTRRFGRVAPRLPPQNAALNLVQGALFAVTFGPIVPPLAHYAIVLAMVAAPSSWIVVRDRPYRAYWLLPFGVGGGAALLLMAAPARQAEAWLPLVLLGDALALAVAGWLDHALLAGTLGAGTCDASPESEAAAK